MDSTCSSNSLITCYASSPRPTVASAVSLVRPSQVYRNERPPLFTTRDRDKKHLADRLRDLSLLFCIQSPFLLIAHKLPRVGAGYLISCLSPSLSIYVLIFCSVSLFPCFTFPLFLFSFALPIFFFCPSLPFLPE